MKEITLKGSFYEMGVQYGKECKKEIKKFTFLTRMMAAVSEGEGRDFFRPKWYHFPGAFLNLRKQHKQYKNIALEFETNIDKYYPEILDMIKGMAESTKIDYKDILFMNCITEYSLKCSAMGAAGSTTLKGSPLLAMNADESKFVQKYEVLLNINPDNGYSYKAVFLAGCIFPNFGMNETGLSVASKLLFLDNSMVKHLRMPNLLKFSILHRCKNVSEAKRILEEIPPAGPGSAAYVADSEQLLVSEESSFYREIKIYENGYHYNCNLPQVEELKKYDQRGKKDDISFFFAVDRERRLGNLFQQYDGKIDEDILHRFISDHGSDEDSTTNKSICVHPEYTKGIKTCCSFIASPKDKTFKVYEGNPCENKVKKYSVN